jgi:hypothetical protein
MKISRGLLSITPSVITSKLLEDTKARVTLRDSQDYPFEGFAAMENDQ